MNKVNCFTFDLQYRLFRVSTLQLFNYTFSCNGRYTDLKSKFKQDQKFNRYDSI